MDQDVARERLQQMRDDLRREITETQDRLDPAIRDTVAGGPHDAVDYAGDEMVLSEEDALADGLRRRLEGVEAALGRVEDGSYGRCSVCGEAIPDERLEARPDAVTCVEHAAAAA